MNPSIPTSADTSKGQPALSAVVVSYRSRQHVLACLAALQATRGIEAQVVVVDNDSRDGVAEAITEQFAAAQVISNQENVGYARAVNQGIGATNSEFVLVMNPDCEVEQEAVGVSMDYLRAHPQTAIVGPKILNADGSLEYSARAFPDHLTFLFNRYSLLTRLFPNNPFSRRYLLTDWDHASVREVDWLSGACLLVRRAAIEQVGAMDEAFFLFNEDVDWCRRMRLAGWAITYVPDAVVVHHVGASKSKVDSKVIYERHRGMIHYFHKHHPANPVLTVIADSLILVRAGFMMAANALRIR